MKKWFLVSLAIFGFLVACGKKDKKQGKIGATLKEASLDCKGKDKDAAKCKAADSTTPVPDSSAILDSKPTASAQTEASQTTTAFPNAGPNDNMSIHLETNQVVVGQFAINYNPTAKDDEYITSRISCRDLSIDQPQLVIVNPNELSDIRSEINLLDDSQILVWSNSKKDKSEIKPFMISCKNNSEMKASRFTNDKSAQIFNLKEGMSHIELLVDKLNEADGGIETSFECTSEDNFLKNEKKVMSQNFVMNKVKLLKGSSVVIKRTANKKIGKDKVNLNDIDPRFKEQKISVISCN